MRERKRVPGTPPALVVEETSYAVGYGRPPKATQFKAGASGNPKGRPKGAKNLRTLAREKLQDKIVVREGGRERRMSKGEIGVTKMINKFAETGDARLALILDKLAGDTDGKAIRIQEAASAASTDEPPSNAAILNWFLETHRADGEGG